jgi:7-cyano-7-deazaguanine synthase
MKVTVVPNRNMIMVSVAAGWAISQGCGAVAYAAHLSDWTIYPDCRLKFKSELGKALRLCHFTPIELMAPFICMSKVEVVARGVELSVPFELTYSCYEGKEKHCGLCGTCTERKEAFKLAGVPDPTVYAE